MAFEKKGKKNIVMTRGDSGIIEFIPNNYEFRPGDTVYLTVKEDEDSYIVFQKVVNNFIDNKAIFIIEPEDTKKLELDTYCYDIQVITVDGSVNTVVTDARITIEVEYT